MSSSSTTEYPYEEGSYTLYVTKHCPFAQRALRAFYAAKVPYKLVEIDLDNKPTWYHLVNPQLKVPALRLPSGEILIESLVISEYVADQFPEAHLLPTDALERAQLRLFVEIFSSKIVPNLYGALRAASAEEQETKKEGILAGIRDASRQLENQWKRVNNNEGLWLGDRVSLAEINTVSFVNQLAAVEIHRGLVVPQSQEYAAFNKWVEAYSARPEYTEYSLADEVIAEKLRKFLA
ncbi:hypothetical protein H4R99_004575 [Coemansia sp. RSA 1722]|nr:hypothetical protein IWW45_004223 [Coemansia sp. RSA 485]KAJ2597274.1 hypothetical protein H4R99_004575 [Coemansia sp. RSA 1722]KAJ2640130.1 hypothetical protein GGF40_000278 [Coemansia sp. RSA 1286]